MPERQQGWRGQEARSEAEGGAQKRIGTFAGWVREVLWCEHGVDGVRQGGLETRAVPPKVLMGKEGEVAVKAAVSVIGIHPRVTPLPDGPAFSALFFVNRTPSPVVQGTLALLFGSGWIRRRGGSGMIFKRDGMVGMNARHVRFVPDYRCSARN